MNRPDNSRPSLVEILGSIKFSRGRAVSHETQQSNGHFARMHPDARHTLRGEDAQLIRSGN